MHDLLDSSTLGIVFNNNQIFLGFGETWNVTDSTHLSQASAKSTHQQPALYVQHAEECQNERSAIVLWLRPLDIKSMGWLECLHSMQYESESGSVLEIERSDVTILNPLWSSATPLTSSPLPSLAAQWWKNSQVHYRPFASSILDKLTPKTRQPSPYVNEASDCQPATLISQKLVCWFYFWFKMSSDLVRRAIFPKVPKTESECKFPVTCTPFRRFKESVIVRSPSRAGPYLIIMVKNQIQPS